ncbi:DNA-directed RNA polymerase subunit alpha [Candidatus Kaiserbacteria bacterium CG10_big_fil_rev_8_21_14_0_10_45_20]|uniref:DNA-directed RNA polymerase subunit alpha n=1 Tax=Candidatus Kaiserbacteria bacterium CG10_big_fil_rev_8_21_14_0_10_45_20 TaxID=1974607 RepID=A0A2H0UGH9_9BACT|nr:MAG: DNA-directed RNA polymerase subunit alpha [Candidatus Kaiserbacteria bacterium CG10_big_fil_rev_8_21_14_0_10_45_20]
MDYSIQLPSKPRIVSEEKDSGVFEIDGLYPGYGHTLGNSLRRIILSSIPGGSVTTLKIDGVSHEFSTIEGVKEDVISIILNLKKVRLKVLDGEEHTVSLSAKGIKTLTAGDLVCPGQVEILNPNQHIADLTDKNASFNAELTVSEGLGYVSKEQMQKERVDIGVIALDAIFTPIRRVNYEVENMRVGDRTDFNRLRIAIETDGTISPKEALEQSISIMIQQLKSIVGFREDEPVVEPEAEQQISEEAAKEITEDAMKLRVESLNGISTRTANALVTASIRTVGGLVRKSESDILALEGLGERGLKEVQDALKALGLSLKA